MRKICFGVATITTHCYIMLCHSLYRYVIVYTHDLEATFDFVSDVKSIFNEDLIGVERIYDRPANCIDDANIKGTVQSIKNLICIAILR